MNQNYFISKDNNDNNNEKINIEQIISKERDIKQIKYTSFSKSEFNYGEYSSINKDSFIKGLGLVFIYFSVIIYSLLYMLTPEKTSNLMFEGDNNSISFNNSLYNYNNKIYKLDTITVRKNKTIIKISKNFRYEKNYKNNMTIELIYSEKQKIINKIVIINDLVSKEINNNIKIYHYYKLNDFPFWLVLFNKDNEDKINITSDYLSFFF